MSAPAPDDTTPGGGGIPSLGTIDLDKKRAARREGRGDAIAVTNQGIEFRLPVELPADAIEPLASLAELPDDAEEDTGTLSTVRHSLEQGLAGLFCSEPKVPADPLTGWPLPLASAHADTCQWPRFLATRPSLDDELELWAGLFGAYGVSLGEALASLTSSAESDGTRSKETSGGPASTRATSGGANRATRRAQKATPAKRGAGTSRR